MMSGSSSPLIIVYVYIGIFVYKVVITLEDNNLKLSYITLHFAASTSNDVAAKVNSIIPSLTNLTSAYIKNYVITKTERTLYALPSNFPQSNIYKTVIVLFTNDTKTNFGAIIIPSPAITLPVDVTEPYRTQRITRERLALSGLLDTMENIPRDGILRNGKVIPNLFAVAVLDWVQK